MGCQFLTFIVLKFWSFNLYYQALTEVQFFSNLNAARAVYDISASKTSFLAETNFFTQNNYPDLHYSQGHMKFDKQKSPLLLFTLFCHFISECDIAYVSPSSYQPPDVDLSDSVRLKNGLNSNEEEDPYQKIVKGNLQLIEKQKVINANP